MLKFTAGFSVEPTFAAGLEGFELLILHEYYGTGHRTFRGGSHLTVFLMCGSHTLIT